MALSVQCSSCVRKELLNDSVRRLQTDDVCVCVCVLWAAVLRPWE